MFDKNVVRYAVVGLGYFAQKAVLPAFRNAKKNSELTALVSGDPVKLAKLGRQYGVRHLWSYEQYEQCLRSGEVDGVYICLPNDLHREYAVRAANAGVHVLCEKPLALSELECREMIYAAEKNAVKLMVGYRLHFEEANVMAVDVAASGKIGTPRIFHSAFTMQVQEGNIRVTKERGGGTLYDIGVYCVNAARNIFGAEPIEVTALGANNGEDRFAEVEEMTGAILRFPNEQIATFTTSFGAASVSFYEIIGTKGIFRLEPAYDYDESLSYELRKDKKSKRKKLPVRDQIGPEIQYFSECVLRDEEPEPSGFEGLADVRVIEALYQSIESGKTISLPELKKKRRPDVKQAARKPPVKEPKLIRARTPRVT